VTEERARFEGMGLPTRVLAVAMFALAAPGCGLALDYDPPDRERDGGASLDASGGRDAAEREDAARDAASDDDAAIRPDAFRDDDAAIETDANVSPDASGACGACTFGVCVHGCDGAFHCVPGEVCSTTEVCGCDGTIYRGQCDAWSHGVDVDPSASRCGGCSDTGDCAGGELCGSCGGIRYCVAQPTCDSIPGPVVCGCDGVTYASPCEAAQAGNAHWADGGCHGENCVDSLDCGDREYCQRSACGDAVGTCTALPPTALLVCGGCSGRRYLSSDLALRREGLLADTCATCTGPQLGCCQGRLGCLAGTTCVLPESASSCDGVCEPAALPAGRCWNDDDCDVRHVCSGAMVCGCGNLCPFLDSPGTCVAR